MIETDMLEAKIKLSQLVEAAERGEQVFLKQNGVQVAQMSQFRDSISLTGFSKMKLERSMILSCSIFSEEELDEFKRL